MRAHANAMVGGTPQGGFTKHQTPPVPVISGGAYGFERINVSSQRRDPNSFLNGTERLNWKRKYHRTARLMTAPGKWRPR